MFSGVFHTAGPRIISKEQMPARFEEFHLRLCYYNICRLADAEKLKHIVGIF